MLLWAGIGQIIFGLIFLGAPQTVGVSFCRFGRRIWRGREGHAPMSMDEACSQSEAPRVFRFLGIVFLLQGIAFICFQLSK